MNWQQQSRLPQEIIVQLQEVTRIEEETKGFN